MGLAGRAGTLSAHDCKDISETAHDATRCHRVNCGADVCEFVCMVACMASGGLCACMRSYAVRRSEACLSSGAWRGLGECELQELAAILLKLQELQQFLMTELCEVR